MADASTTVAGDDRGFSRRSMLKRTAVTGAALVWAVPTVEALGVGKAFAGVTGGSACPSPNYVTNVSWCAFVLKCTTGSTELGCNTGDLYALRCDITPEDGTTSWKVLTGPEQTSFNGQNLAIITDCKTDTNGVQYYVGNQDSLPPGCGFEKQPDGTWTTSSFRIQSDGSCTFNYPTGSEQPTYECSGYILTANYDYVCTDTSGQYSYTSQQHCWSQPYDPSYDTSTDGSDGSTGSFTPMIQSTSTTSSTTTTSTTSGTTTTTTQTPSNYVANTGSIQIWSNGTVSPAAGSGVPTAQTYTD